MRGAVRGEPAVELVEGATCPHRGDRLREPRLLRAGVMDRIRRDDREPMLAGEGGEQVVPARVERVAVIGELDVGEPRVVVDP